MWTEIVVTFLLQCFVWVGLGAECCTKCMMCTPSAVCGQGSLAGLSPNGCGDRSDQMVAGIVPINHVLPVCMNMCLWFWFLVQAVGNPGLAQFDCPPCLPPTRGVGECVWASKAAPHLGPAQLFHAAGTLVSGLLKAFNLLLPTSSSAALQVSDRAGQAMHTANLQQGPRHMSAPSGWCSSVCITGISMIAEKLYRSHRSAPECMWVACLSAVVFTSV